MPFALFLSFPQEIPPALPVPTPRSPCSLGAFGGLVGTYVSVLQAVLPLNRVENPAEYHQHLSVPTQLLRCLSGFSPGKSWGNFQGRNVVSQEVPEKSDHWKAVTDNCCQNQWSVHKITTRATSSEPRAK